jgi:hypothetical protein
MGLELDWAKTAKFIERRGRKWGDCGEKESFCEEVSVVGTKKQFLAE